MELYSKSTNLDTWLTSSESNQNGFKNDNRKVYKKTE